MAVGAVLAALWGSLGWPGVGRCADWPQWRGPKRNGISAETGLAETWPESGPRALWTVTGLGKGFSTVSVSEGLVYTTGLVGETDVLFVFDLNGRPAWRRDCGPGWSRSHAGARSTPTVHQGLVYVMTGRGTLACFEAKTGRPKWSVDTTRTFGGVAPRWGFAESVLIVGRAVICTPGGKDATVAALDRTTGKTIWTSRGLSEKSGYCSPILVRRGGTLLIVTMTEKSVVGLELNTGSVLWKHPHVNKWNVNANTPVHEDGLVYVTSGYGKGGEMYELSPDGTRAEKRWTEKKLDCHHGNTVLTNGYVYGSASTGQKWICLDLRSGKVMYEVKGVGKGSLTCADGMLYCYGERGRVALVRATPEGHRMISSFAVERGGGPHWAHPVISGGRLYIRHGDVLMAHDIAGR